MIVAIKSRSFCVHTPILNANGDFAPFSALFFELETEFDHILFGGRLTVSIQL
jgi:hypothetical protein